MESLLAADSFRVRVNNGRAESRGLNRHLERFTHATIQAASIYEEPAHYSRLEAFIRSAVHEITEYGDGFPRLELGSDVELGLQLRPPPELRDSVELRSLPLLSTNNRLPPLSRGLADHPERKGPNIERYAALNRELGAEALLRGPKGQVLEGATTSVVWWRGDVLYAIRERRRVASVTEAILTTIARERGVIPRTASILPEGLAHYEAWAINALHGISVITSIDGVQLPHPNQERLNGYREALDETWEPMPGQ